MKVWSVNNTIKMHNYLQKVGEVHREPLISQVSVDPAWFSKLLYIFTAVRVTNFSIRESHPVAENIV